MPPILTREGVGGRLISSERFEPGEAEWDSALLWFLDVRIIGDSIPSDAPDVLRDWLTQLSQPVREGLHAVAAEIAAGIDKDWPVKRDFLIPLDGVRGEIVGSCLRRVTGTQFAAKLQYVAEHWEEMLGQLAPLHVECV